MGERSARPEMQYSLDCSRFCETGRDVSTLVARKMMTKTESIDISISAEEVLVQILLSSIELPG